MLRFSKSQGMYNPHLKAAHSNNDESESSHDLMDEKVLDAKIRMIYGPKDTPKKDAAAEEDIELNERKVSAQIRTIHGLEREKPEEHDIELNERKISTQIRMIHGLEREEPEENDIELNERKISTQIRMIHGLEREKDIELGEKTAETQIRMLQQHPQSIPQNFESNDDGDVDERLLDAKLRIIHAPKTSERSHGSRHNRKDISDLGMVSVTGPECDQGTNTTEQTPGSNTSMQQQKRPFFRTRVFSDKFKTRFFDILKVCVIVVGMMLIFVVAW